MECGIKKAMRITKNIFNQISFSLIKTNSEKIFDFISRGVLVRCGINFIIALMIFVVEVIFAFSIQALVTVLGNESFTVLSIFSYSVNGIEEALVVLFVTGLIKSILLWCQLYNGSIISVLFETINRKRVINWAFYNRDSELGVAANLFNDRSVGAGNFISSLINFSSRSVTLFLIVAALLALSFKVTISSIVFLLILYPIITTISRKIRFITQIIHQDIDNTLSRILTGVKNSFLFHLYGKNIQESMDCQRNMNSYLNNYKKYHFLNSLKTIIPQFFGIFYICIIAYVSSKYNLIQNEVLIAYFYLFIRLMLSIGELGNLLSYISLTKPRFLSVFDWYETNLKKPMTVKSSSKKINNVKDGIGVIFSDISFKYRASKNNIFTKFSFTLEPYHTLVITGKSGVGKSTLMHLVAGLLEPDSGSISISANKKNYLLTDYKTSIQSYIGYVGPDTYIISGSVKDNLLFGAHKKNIPNEDIFKALELASCDFVDNTSIGLTKELSEQGEGLSAGQKQRLSLARALLRKPKLLLLDEVTSHLDNNSAKKLINSLKQLKKNMTIIVITHKQDMLEIADHHLELNKLL